LAGSDAESGRCGGTAPLAAAPPPRLAPKPAQRGLTGSETSRAACPALPGAAVAVAGMSAIGSIADGIARRTARSTKREPGATVLLTLTSAANTVAAIRLWWETSSSGDVPELDAIV
jgi:hypothetical protein